MTLRRSQATTRLPATPTSARAARRFVDRRLAQWDRNMLAPTAELLTSELVTNAVVHAGTKLKLRVRKEPTGVLVEVVDENAALPVVRERPLRSTSGRGLVLVDALASDWGVEPVGRRKRVWFRLDVDGHARV